MRLLPHDEVERIDAIVPELRGSRISTSLGKPRSVEELPQYVSERITHLNELLILAFSCLKFRAYLQWRASGENESYGCTLWESPTFLSQGGLWIDNIFLLGRGRREEVPKIFANLSDATMISSELQSLLVMQIEDIRFPSDLVRVIVDAYKRGG